ncbi:MAG: FtsX-like permease family protein [Gammaproteobacteria bacterium]|nr:FtsX-like permease family protein [Gammaproteobacteria bacterium]
MNPVLLRSSLNFFGRHPWQLFLAILGIALGVAVAVSIALVKSSAEESFAHSTQTIVGKTTHRLVGGPDGIDESFYTKLRVEYGLRNIAPIVSGYVKATVGEHGETLILLGTDPFAEGDFREYSKLKEEQADNNVSVLTRLLSEANTAILDQKTAERFSLLKGGSLKVLSGGQQKSINILTSFDSESGDSIYNLENLLLSDISTAQEILSMPGRLSHIDVLLEERSPFDEHDLRKLLPGEIELLNAASQNASLKQMTSAFHTNLTALSLLALLVGMFLIFNTMTFLVVQRRTLIGKLRALGASRTQIFFMISFEAFIIGTIATLLGLILGIQLAQSLLMIVGRTINELYYFLPDTSLALNAGILIKGSLLGVFATVIAAIPPALEAAGVHPSQAMQRSALESNARTLSARASLGGLCCLIASLVLIQLSGSSIAQGFTAIFIIIIGFALLTPMLTLLSMTLLKPLLGKLLGINGRQACDSVSSSLSRTTAAIAALMISVATVIGIGLMVNNFRFSVNHWLESMLRADLYVSVAGPTSSASNNTLDITSLQQIKQLDSVHEVSTVRRIQIEATTGRTDLLVYGLNKRAYEGFDFKEKAADDIWQAFEQL